jgi:hypothetical protein
LIASMFSWREASQKSCRDVEIEILRVTKE